MSEVILLSIIALLVAILFFNAYLYDKTLEEIKIPRTEMEKEIQQLKETIVLARAIASAKDKKNELGDDSKRNN
jgi:hypothetical protein